MLREEPIPHLPRGSSRMLASDFAGEDPRDNYYFSGFRVATVPEPSGILRSRLAV